MQDVIHATLTESFPDASIQVDGQGGKYLVQIVDEGFQGLLPVKRQQRVYAGLGDLITSGQVHAVTIQAKTPAEAARAKGLEGQ